MRNIMRLAALISSVLITGSLLADTFQVEIDYMVGGSPSHSHKPSQLVLDAVIQMFACQGHTLVIDLDDQVPHYEELVPEPVTCGSFWSYTGVDSTVASMRDAYFDHAGVSGWHYCIFAHQYRKCNATNKAGDCIDCSITGSSGRANGGNLFIVTLGNFDGQTGTEYQQAATFAHELGHNLGLSHCGSQYCGSIEDSSVYVGPYPPNMPSIMSYRYQLKGLRTTMICSTFGLTIEDALFKDIDFSHGRMCPLNENNLDELVGTGMVWTDWNCDGTLQTGVVQDINGDGSGWCTSLGNKTFLYDYDEWSNLEDGSQLLAQNTEKSREILAYRQRMLDLEPCISAEEWKVVTKESAHHGDCSDPVLTVEPCINGENVYISTFSRLQMGTCTFPYASVQTAHDFSPSGSVFFFAPGTYNETGTVILSKPGKYFCERKDGSGKAVIR
ncbi:MAG: hypothetical protein JSV84_17875 [Gemmatimonadota bacterium]|nr:MAG: hypothetical protein JSV84_17875 [Gemmatimonadota bacterium]